MPERPDNVPILVGDYIELEIEAFADGADAFGRLGGYVVLVAGVLPGERISAKVSSASAKFGRAELVTVLQASPQRVTPSCRHFMQCGGCHLQHVDYAQQLVRKRERLEKAIVHHMGDRAPKVLPTLAPPSPWGQRSKIALHLKGAGRHLVGGLRPMRAIGLVPIGDCVASDPKAVELALDAVAQLGETGLAAWDDDNPHGVLRSIVVRRSQATGESHLVIVTTPGRVPQLALAAAELQKLGATTVSVNENDGPLSQLMGRDTEVLRGPRRIREVVDGVEYMLSPDAFFQTSHAGARHAVQQVVEWLAPTRRDVVADFYCGGGLFSLQLARHAKHVIGIEQSMTAVRDAEASTNVQQVRNVEFHRVDVGRALAGWRRKGMPRPNLICLDPPRYGLPPRAAQYLGEMAPRRMAYVSCEPDTLARDLAELAECGMRTNVVLPLDMFPQTYHVEAVALLEPGTDQAKPKVVSAPAAAIPAAAPAPEPEPLRPEMLDPAEPVEHRDVPADAGDAGGDEPPEPVPT